jgi:hypothetical protein
MVAAALALFRSYFIYFFLSRFQILMASARVLQVALGAAAITAGMLPRSFW